MKFLLPTFAVLTSLFLLSCSEAEKTVSNSNEVPETGEGKTEEQKKAEAETAPMKKRNTDPASGGEEIITLAGGCFWCTEAVLEKIDGVKDVVSGYMGGHVENPTYQQICTKTTGHAEVIQVTFETSKISLDEVLNVFWQAHDPTTLNQQGADRGPQYRSAIFYHSPQQKTIAEQSKTKLDASGIYADPAVTEITEASTFWVAEDYHQDYYQLNGDNRYCRAVIVPKLKKLGLE
jgi:peptide-methionine (S)-S-oxide reductase